MKLAPNMLPNKQKTASATVIDLQAIIKEKEHSIQQKNSELKKNKQQIEQLLDYIQLLRHKRFGRKSEQYNPDQKGLFDEAELEQLLVDEPELAAEMDDTDVPSSTATASKTNKPVRRPLPTRLERVEKIIDLPEAEKKAMGDQWKLIGYVESEQLAIIPRQCYVILTKRAKYARKDDSGIDAEQNIKIAPRPMQIIPKSIGHSSLIAEVVTGKFVDGLPFYRQEKAFARDGIDLSRQTMSGWVIQLDANFSALMQLMKRQFYEGKVIHIDETRLQVLKEPDRENTQQSYMWVYRGGLPDRPVIWFQYHESRRGQVPVDFLYPSEGIGNVHSLPHHSLTLMTDGYRGYNALCQQPGITKHAACWAHARRKFVEATKGRKNTAAAHQMVSLVAKLYQIERFTKDHTADERKVIRQAKAKPILDKIKIWLDSKAGKVLPKSLLGKAIGYTLALWPQLIVYLEEGTIPIDNNPAENAIRPFVIGRKNWLFSGSPRGAHASATLYSLIESAKANGLEPRAYLNHLFEALPNADTEQALEKLLPQNIQKSDFIRRQLRCPV